MVNYVMIFFEIPDEILWFIA